MHLHPLQITEKTPIYVFWHIFIDAAGLQRGKDIIRRQYTKLLHSGLLERCTAVYVGYVSTLAFPHDDIISHPKIKIITQKPTGYEGVTTTALKEFCDTLTTDGLVLYIHNRGMSHPADSPSEDWTLMMEYFVIEHWQKGVKQLETHYTSGCELWSHEHRINPRDFIFHYSGNFWWSRSEYIKLLKYPTFENRHIESEDWILQLVGHGIDKEHFGILHRTSKNRYERGMVHSYIDRYPKEYYQSASETPDIPINPNKFHGEHCRRR